MTARMKDDEIITAGIAALVKELGPSGAIAFLKKLGIGGGDYTSERSELLDDLTVDEIERGVAEITAARGK